MGKHLKKRVYREGWHPWNRGKTNSISETTREKLRLVKLGKRRQPHSEDTKQKISSSLEGHIVTNSTRAKLSRSHKGKVLTEEHKRKICASSSDSCLGTNEESLLNQQEMIDRCKIDRNFAVLTYKPDGYCHETNTVYEVYEKYHDRQVFKDLIRENKICNYLACDFVIIVDRTH